MTATTMRWLILPDIHDKLRRANQIIEREPHDRLFLNGRLLRRFPDRRDRRSRYSQPGEAVAEFPEHHLPPRQCLLTSPMMFSDMTCLLKRRRAFSTVSPSCSFTSAKWHLYPAPIFLVALWSHFRRWSRLALSQLFRQFLAGLEACTPFCGDVDGLPSARVAALALLPLFHHEAAKSAKVYPFVRLERFRDHRQDRVHCYFNLGLLQFSLGP